ncbi:MAG: Uma2 family endonuclease [Leptolyngbyaceae bacterium]|nr:Uma2 family endonuclease [Leptolyngbyaceae bacterium]
MVQAPYSAQTLYPDSDGQPMSDNTEQYEWIVRLVTNLKHLLKDKTAFVAGDLLWYPVEVQTPPAPCQAPDAMVAIGRPPGYRGSYKQWEEEGIAPQVVFEILSPKNTRREMAEKQKFYETYGVLEAYYYDPQRQDFWGFVRQNPDEVCTLITALYLPWTSPLLQIRFELFEDGLTVFYPNGDRFVDPNVSLLELEQAQLEREQARQSAEQTQTKLDQALAKLQELGIDPNTLT